MRAYLKYFSYVLRHKWFVLRAGLATGAPLWRLLIHDWTKFLPSEFIPYANYYQGGGKENQSYGARASFDRAWLRHQRRNDHHWQYWVLLEDTPGNRYQRFVLQSPDCMTAYCIAEYPTPGSLEGRGEVWLDGVAVNAKDGERMTSQRLQVAQRCVDAANRYVAVEMPEDCIREMLADWIGAGKAITGQWSDFRTWYAANKGTMILHPATRRRVEQLMRLVTVPPDLEPV